MTPEQKAAYINAQTACMLAEMAGMQTSNNAAFLAGTTPVFSPEDFLNLPARYGIHHNAIVGFFSE